MAGKSANPIFFNKKRLDVQNTSPHPTVCIRVSPPPLKITIPLFFAKLPQPLNLQTVQAPPPPFQTISPPIYWFFVNPPNNQIFQRIPILKFSSLTSSHLLTKVTKFVVEISQFKFLVMTEKSITVYKLFLLLNISDFSSFFM